MIPLVAASESGTAQTIDDLTAGRPMHRWGCTTRPWILPDPQGVTKHRRNRRTLERATIEGDSPVRETMGASCRSS